MAEMRFVHAVNRALHDAMAADEDVFVLGEDIANAGGSFRATKGLLDSFGAERVLDTPISEAALTGMTVGAALTGKRPVAEIMFMDFMTLTMDALVNQAAKARSMFGGQVSVPLVVRTPHGGGLNAGPQHSQCLEAWFAHVPGLKVLCPATPADAYTMLRTAIEDPDPIIFVENKALYGMKGDVPENGTPVPIGEARIAREGIDATIVCYGMAVGLAEAAADELAIDGINVEIIDLRSLSPWDEVAVLESLAKTHRLVVAHEAVEAHGIGAEIVARMADVGFDELDGPIIRVAAPFVPVPFARSLEAAYLPKATDIVAAVKRTLE